MAILPFLWLSLLGGNVRASTMTVPGDYATIQGAIDAARDGDEILVAPGIYNERIEIRTGVVLRGPGLDATTALITGNGTGTVITFEEAPAAVLEGFEIAGAGEAETDALILLDGSSPDIRDNLLEGPGPTGVYATRDSDPHIDGNRFLALGRAIFLEDGSDPSITGNEFSYCTGEAIHVGQGCSALVQDNLFHDNDRDIRCDRSNAPWILGNQFEATALDAVTLSGTSPTLSDNTFRGALGTALSLEAGSYPDILENWFDGNGIGIRLSASSPAISANWFTRNTGAAIYVLSQSYPTIYQNVLQDNHDGIVLEGSPEAGDASPHILNNTIVTGSGAGIRCADQAFPAIGNNIIAFNSDFGVLCQGSSVPTLSYNDVYGNTPEDFGGRCTASDTDMSVDPGFTTFTNDGNPDNDDLHTSSDSPTHDAGNPFPEYDDPDGSRNDLGAYGGPLEPAFADVDGDGYRTEDGDCNDADPQIHPGAEELVDGVDNDCDGLIDVTAGDDDASAGDDSPLGDDDATAGDDDSPPGDDDVSGGDDDGSLSDDDTSIQDDDASSSDDDTSPAGDDTVSGDDDTEEPTATPEELASPTQETGGGGCTCNQARSRDDGPGSTTWVLTAIAMAFVTRRRARTHLPRQRTRSA